MTHHGGARDLAEGADMRQARRTVAGLEQHLVLRLFLQPRHNRLRLLERPGVGLFGERTQIARTGKIIRGHQRGLRAAETSDSASKCKIGLSTVVPGRCEASNPESRDSPMCNCTSEVCC